MKISGLADRRVLRPLLVSTLLVSAVLAVARLGLDWSVSTDRTSYEAGEAVVIHAELCNRGILPRETQAPNYRLYFEVISGDGHVVADTGHYITTVDLRPPYRLGPRECVELETVWDQHHWNDDAVQGTREMAGLPLRGPRVPPGTYRVRVSGEPSDPFEVRG